MAKKKKDEVKIKLGILDRINVTKLLPDESDILTQIVVVDIGKKIRFTQAENKAVGITVTSPGNLGWKKNKIVEIIFTKPEIELLKTQITDLDKKKKVTQQMLPTILKIRDCNV